MFDVYGKVFLGSSVNRLYVIFCSLPINLCLGLYSAKRDNKCTLTAYLFNLGMSIFLQFTVILHMCVPHAKPPWAGVAGAGGRAGGARCPSTGSTPNSPFACSFSASPCRCLAVRVCPSWAPRLRGDCGGPSTARRCHPLAAVTRSPLSPARRCHPLAAVTRSYTVIMDPYDEEFKLGCLEMHPDPIQQNISGVVSPECLEYLEVPLLPASLLQHSSSSKHSASS